MKAVRHGVRLALLAAVMIGLRAVLLPLIDTAPSKWFHGMASGDHLTSLGYVALVGLAVALLAILLLAWWLSSKALGLPFRET